MGPANPLSKCVACQPLTLYGVSELGHPQFRYSMLTVRCQAIAWTNADSLSTGSLRTKFNMIWIKRQNISINKMHLKMLSVKYQLFCSGSNLQHINKTEVFKTKFFTGKLWLLRPEQNGRHILDNIFWSWVMHMCHWTGSLSSLFQVTWTNDGLLCFKCISLNENISILNKSALKFDSGSKWHYCSIDSGNGLAPYRCQAITCTNAGTDLYRHMASLDHNELMDI